MEQKKISRTKKRVIRRQALTTNSIVCGTENPASVGCIFYELEDGEVAARFTPGIWHEGHTGVMHGGLISSVLDEVMGRSNRIYNEATGEFRAPYVTGEITVRFLQPILIGENMIAYGRVEREEGRKRFISAEVVDEAGNVRAVAASTFFRVDVGEHRIDSKKSGNRGELLPGDPAEL